MPRSAKRLLPFPLAIAVGLTLLAGSAAAATRYAAPGGSGADPCADRADACSLYDAADVNAPGTTIAAGDVVELTPGIYSEAQGDLGPSGRVQLLEETTVRGEAGGQRPLIRLEANSGSGAFILFGGKLADVLILNEAPSGPAISLVLEAATVERAVVRSTHSSAIACTVQEGTLRDSACLNEAGGVAVGASVSTFPGTHPVHLRNVTAIGSGPGSVGLDFGYFGSAVGVIGAIDGKAVIAQGAANDVIARGMTAGPAGTGASTAIVLDHSDYATTETQISGGGSASVTTAGTNGNVTQPPLLADDGYSQLSGSPTIDSGALDGLSGSADVDGRLRTIGAAPDIGADELGHATATAVACPATVVLGAPLAAVCTLTVTDTAALAPTAPSGTVQFEVGFGLETGACGLTPVSGIASSCQLSYLPTAEGVGPQQVVALYSGDPAHERSGALGSITVIAPAKTGAGPAAAGGTASGPPEETIPAPAPQTRLRKHPPAQTAKRLAKFTFAADQSGASFQCKLDKGSFRTCRSPFKRQLQPGRHVFRVRAQGPGGALDASPAVFRWQILAG
jgi:hypothetical protein